LRILKDKDFARGQCYHEVGSCCSLLVCEQDFDPMAEHRAPRVGDRDDEYKARRRNLMISPPRHDPFAGKMLFVVICILTDIYR